MSIERLIFNRFIRHKNTGYTRPVVRIATIGVVLSCVVMILSVCISFGFKNEVSRQVFGFSGHLRIGNYQMSSHGIPTPISRKSIDWGSIQGVGKFHKQAWATQIGLVKTDLYNHGILLKGVDKEFDFSFFELCLREGRIPQLTDTSTSNEVLISQTLAQKLYLKLGDKLRTYFVAGNDVRPRAFTICGIYESGFSTFDEKMIIGDLRHIQNLNDWSADEVGGFEIILPHSETRNLDDYAHQFNQYLPFEWVAIPITSDYPEIFNWLELMDINVVVILVIMALVIAISLISVFVVMVIEKTNEIGIFKTMGMSLATYRLDFLFYTKILSGLQIRPCNLLYSTRSHSI